MSYTVGEVISQFSYIPSLKTKNIMDHIGIWQKYHVIAMKK